MINQRGRDSSLGLLELLRGLLDILDRICTLRGGISFQNEWNGGGRLLSNPKNSF